ncbi:YfgG family protein [Serratia ureilytica]
MRKKTTGQMTKIVLFISFIILVGRLLYAAVVAVPHHQEKAGRCAKRRRSQRTATGRLL